MDCGLLPRCLLWSKASLVGGILSTSLVFCENNVIGTKSTSLTSFDSFEYSLQTKFVATSFNLGSVWNGVLQIVANGSIRDGTSCINELHSPCQKVGLMVGLLSSRAFPLKLNTVLSGGLKTRKSISAAASPRTQLGVYNPPRPFNWWGEGLAAPAHESHKTSAFWPRCCRPPCLFIVVVYVHKTLWRR